MICLSTSALGVKSGHGKELRLTSVGSLLENRRRMAEGQDRTKNEIRAAARGGLDQRPEIARLRLLARSRVSRPEPHPHHRNRKRRPKYERGRFPCRRRYNNWQFNVLRRGGNGRGSALLARLPSPSG